MKRNSIARALLVAALFTFGAVCATPASAAPVTYTYAGEVSDGLDVTGVFNLAGHDLRFQPFTAVFTRDDATAGATRSDDGATSFIYGGNPAPVTASLTINGVTRAVTIGADTVGQQYQFKVGDSSSGYEQFDHLVVNPGSVDFGTYRRDFLEQLNLGAYGFDTNYLANHDYHSLSSLTRAATPGLRWYGSGRFVVVDVDAVSGAETLRDSAEFNLYPTSVTVSGGVPEPATWALMLAGFGLAGAALRRRRRRGVPLALGASLAALVLTAAAPASAAIFTATSIGVVLPGATADELGLFGPVGGSLDGLAYKIVMKMDSSKGVISGNPQFTILDGVSLGLSTITINGFTQNIAGGWFDNYERDTFSFPDASDMSFGAGDLIIDPATLAILQVNTLNAFVTRSDHGISKDLFDLGGQNYCLGADFCRAQFHFATQDVNGSLIGTTRGVLDATEFTVTAAPSSAPEPSVWALMIAGFGGIGATLRRRRGLLLQPGAASQADGQCSALRGDQAISPCRHRLPKVMLKQTHRLGLGAAVAGAFLAATPASATTINLLPHGGIFDAGSGYVDTINLNPYRRPGEVFANLRVEIVGYSNSIETPTIDVAPREYITTIFSPDLTIETDLYRQVTTYNYAHSKQDSFSFRSRSTFLNGVGSDIINSSYSSEIFDKSTTICQFVVLCERTDFYYQAHNSGYFGYSYVNASLPDSYLFQLNRTGLFDYSIIGLTGTVVMSSAKLYFGSYMPVGVPEPSTWFMMTLGAGLAGSMLRRRSRASAVRA